MAASNNTKPQDDNFNAYEKLGVKEDDSFGRLKKSLRDEQLKIEGSKNDLAPDELKQKQQELQEVEKKLGLDDVKIGENGEIEVGVEAIRARQQYDAELANIREDFTPLPFDELPEEHTPLPFDEIEEPYTPPPPPALVSSGGGAGGGASSMVTDAAVGKAKKKIVSATVKKAGSSAAKKALTKKAANAATKKAAQMALGAATGGTSLAAQLAIEAALFAKSHAVGIGKAIGKGTLATISGISGFFAGGIGISASGPWGGASAGMVGGIMGLILIVTIINTGAYIVPQGASLSGADVDDAIQANFECINFTGPWPEDGLATYRQATERIEDFPKYVKDICKAGDITIQYIPYDRFGDGRGGSVFSSGKMEIYPIGLGTYGNVLYVFAHELGHIYSARNSSIKSLFSGTVWGKSPYPQDNGILCTYPSEANWGVGIDVSYSDEESFAETIALYIGGSSPPTGFAKGASSGNRLVCLDGTFKDGRYSESWQFARENIFSSESGW